LKAEDKRPSLTKTISLKDFKEFYWLKKELSDFCREQELGTSGSKLELASRIETYLQTGMKTTSPRKTTRPTSKFDWNTEILDRTTIITDSYKNTENVRVFLENEVGTKFKFNVKFMNWMKNNIGKTLDDAITEWHSIRSLSNADKDIKDIAPQFEYNTYLRDFLAANPGTSRSTGIQLWKIKKSLRGDNKYKATDLSLLS